jgi:hypothetical protein
MHFPQLEANILSHIYGRLSGKEVITYETLRQYEVRMGDWMKIPFVQYTPNGILITGALFDRAWQLLQSGIALSEVVETIRLEYPGSQYLNAAAYQNVRNPLTRELETDPRSPWFAMSVDRRAAVEHLVHSYRSAAIWDHFNKKNITDPWHYIVEMTSDWQHFDLFEDLILAENEGALQIRQIHRQLLENRRDLSTLI